MTAVDLHYNAYGLRNVSAREMQARRRFVLSHDFSTSEEFHKPLNSYQNKEQTLSVPELVQARYNDEVRRLRERYQPFLCFPESPEYRSFVRQQQEMKKDYQDQKRWVGFYQGDNSRVLHLAQLAALRLTTGTLLFGAGTLSAISKSPLTPITTSLFYIGALANFYATYRNVRDVLKIPQDKKYVQMVLEDWHKPNRFERYNRALFNDSQRKPTWTRISNTLCMQNKGCR